MRKFNIFLSALVLLLLTPVLTAYASTLKLTRIGALDLGGKNYAEWWYTGTYPTFYGEADANASVKVTINSEDHSVTADSAGKWSYFAPINKGDYTVVLSSGDASYTFKLHLGQEVPAPAGITSNTTAESTQSTTPVPSTGNEQIFAILFGAGVLLLSSYFYVWGNSPIKHSAFEKKMINEI